MSARLSSLYKNGKSRSQIWAEKNPERAKALAKAKRKRFTRSYKDKINEKQREIRHLSKEIGNCVACYKPKEPDKYAQCLDCRLYHRRYNKKAYLKRRSKK